MAVGRTELELVAETREEYARVQTVFGVAKTVMTSDGGKAIMAGPAACLPAPVC
jgi:hypothetical protein